MEHEHYFAVAAAELWNSLPDNIKDVETIIHLENVKNVLIFAMRKAHSLQCFLLCQLNLNLPLFTYLSHFYLAIPLYFFILKAHRDFSLNVICAIQAWFMIIISIIFSMPSVCVHCVLYIQYWYGYKTHPA